MHVERNGLMRSSFVRRQGDLCHWSPIQFSFRILNSIASLPQILNSMVPKLVHHSNQIYQMVYKEAPVLDWLRLEAKWHQVRSFVPAAIRGDWREEVNRLWAARRGNALVERHLQNADMTCYLVRYTVLNLQHHTKGHTNHHTPIINHSNQTWVAYCRRFW